MKKDQHVSQMGADLTIQLMLSTMFRFVGNDDCTSSSVRNGVSLRYPVLPRISPGRRASSTATHSKFTGRAFAFGALRRSPRQRVLGARYSPMLSVFSV
jgi:hypothetical protein